MTETERYRYLVDARNFHYENFNKWMTFFYVAIGAIFLGYYSDGINKITNGRLLLNILGIITSLFFYWSGKGYYYWETNWIMKIHDYERQFSDKDKIYGSFANKKVNNDYYKITSGANISTSKISLSFAFCISTVWVYLLISDVHKYFWKYQNLYYQVFFLAFSVLVVKLLGIIPKLFLTSNMAVLKDLKI